VGYFILSHPVESLKIPSILIGIIW